MQDTITSVLYDVEKNVLTPIVYLQDNYKKENTHKDLSKEQ